MSELKKEELLDWLDELKYGWSYYPKACLYKKGLVDQAYEQIKALIQKPGVTEEWIEKKARGLLPSIGYKVHGEYLKSHIEIAKDFIRSLFKEVK